MADPLSIAASVTALISAGITTTTSLVEFYTSYKHQDSKLGGMTEKLQGLLKIFESLSQTLSNRKFQADERSLIKNIEISIEKCDELIQDLQNECDKFKKATSDGVIAVFKVAGRRATYPFRQSTLLNLDEAIDEIRGNLAFALDGLQLKDNQRMQDDIDEIRLVLDLIRSSQISADIRDWLKAPDVTVNHNAACAKRHPRTGMWLVKGSIFAAWLAEQNSFLWFNGFAGTGKSVLCSTAIQYVFRHRRSDPRIGIAFFYFTFNDESKQNESAMLRALLLQLSSQLEDGHSDLTRLYMSYKPGIPPSAVLTDQLHRLIQKYRHVYIMLDALDESPRNVARGHMLDTLETIRNWLLPGLHLLVTSRNEIDIRDCLSPSPNQEVEMENAGINKDIADFVSDRLRYDRTLRKWSSYHDKIQETLVNRAQGVFRWVECQFKSLQSCPRSEAHLDHLLSSLPRSLDETYERMLCNIDPSLVEDAKRILTLLCFAATPLTVQELIDGIAVDSNPARLNVKRRLQNADDIHEICLGLLDINIITNDKTYFDRAIQSQLVRVAHFSVQEYLLSDRIQYHKAAKFSLNGGTAHADIALVCLIYLLEPGLSSFKARGDVVEEYPLAPFAARYWYYHYQHAEDYVSELNGLIFKLFQQHDSFLTWLRLHDPDQSWMPVNFDRKLDEIASPMYYAALFGLDQVLHQLMVDVEREKKTSTNDDKPLHFLTKIACVNAQGGKHGNALQAASANGHEEVVQRLLNNDADVNAQCGTYGNALQAASVNGHEDIVQILLKNDADVNAQGGTFDNALRGASELGHERIVHLVIEKGADVNAPGKHGTALYNASREGHERIVHFLIEKGADVNAQELFKSSALQGACTRGHEKIVRLLVEKGADVNAAGIYGTALQEASAAGHEKIVRLLVEKGAHVNDAGEYGTALQRASQNGHESVMQLLIEKGADVNDAGKGGTALQKASFNGHESIVQLLIEKGADVNASGRYGTALQQASENGHETTVQLLIEKKADVNVGGNHGTALQIASENGHETTVQLLIEKGADVNARGNVGTALQNASQNGHESIVQLLIEKGADVNAAGIYGTALQEASAAGHEKIVRLLIEKGADVNAVGEYGTVLQNASLNGHESIVQLLIEKGADVNAAGEYGTALQRASQKGHETTVHLLIERGADVNARDNYGTALQRASEYGHETIVQLLIEKEADVNAAGVYGTALQNASRNGHESIVRLLIEKGADVNAVGEYGTALENASGHETIVQ